jgi:GST-like protein
MSKPYVLYTGRRSGAASVEVMLAALGLEHELRDAAPWTDPPGAYLEELKTVSPLGQLPTLVTPAGEVLTESVAVLWTLMERHPSDWVPPLSSKERAACLRWMSFAAATVYTAVGVADYPQRWTTAADAAAHKAVEAAALARQRMAWDIIAAQYHGTPFFLGGQPRVCDVYLANLSKWWLMRDYLRVAQPKFSQLLDRIDALPEVAPVWARHWDGTTIEI